MASKTEVEAGEIEWAMVLTEDGMRFGAHNVRKSSVDEDGRLLHSTFVRTTAVVRLVRCPGIIDTTQLISSTRHLPLPAHPLIRPHPWPLMIAEVRSILNPIFL